MVLRVFELQPGTVEGRRPACPPAAPVQLGAPAGGAAVDGRGPSSRMLWRLLGRCQPMRTPLQILQYLELRTKYE